MKIGKREVAIGLTLGAALLLSSMVIINYTDALFVVVLGWILIPVFIARILRGILRRA